MSNSPNEISHPVRPARPEDAESLLKLFNRIDRETDFMLLEPGERQDTVAEQDSKITGFADDERRVMLVAEVGLRLVGFCVGIGGRFKRRSSCAELVLGVERASWGQGVGTALLRELDRWAMLRGMRRLELTVVAQNDRAIALYKKAGFEVEGVRRRSMRIDGALVDELYMGKLLELST